MTCQQSSTSYRNPKDLIDKSIYSRNVDNEGTFTNDFTDSIISNPLFDEIFTDFSAKEKYDFTIESNEGKIGSSRVRAREEESGNEQLHANKKRKVISNASDMLLEVRESYAFVQGADIYNDTSPQFFNNTQNVLSSMGKNFSTFRSKQVASIKQEGELSYSYDLDDKWDRQADVSGLDADKCSSTQSKQSFSPDPVDVGAPNSFTSPQKTLSSFHTYDYSNNQFNASFPSHDGTYKVDKTYDSSADPLSPVKAHPSFFPEPNMCHLLHNKSPGFLSHPLYNLLKDLIIADMNFCNPSFPFDLILHLPETFERLLHNYFTRNPGISLAHVHPVAHTILLDSLRQAHISLISKIQSRKVAEGIPIVSQRRISRKQAAELNNYLFINDNFSTSCSTTTTNNNNINPDCSINNYNGINDNIVLSVNSDGLNNSNDMDNNNITSHIGNSNHSINGSINGNPYEQKYPSRLKPVSLTDAYMNNVPISNPLNSPLNKNLPLNNNVHLLGTSVNGIHPASSHSLNTNHPFLHQPMYPPYKLYNTYSTDRFNSAMPPHPSAPSQVLPPYHMTCNPANPFPSRVMMMMEVDRRASNSPRKFSRLLSNPDNPSEKTGKNKVLPKEAVNKMMEWLKEHEENPYPNDDQKEALIAETKLSINQINYWFTNARRRVLPKWAHQKHLEEQERLRNVGKIGTGSSGGVSGNSGSGGSGGSDGGGCSSGGENGGPVGNNGKSDRLKLSSL